VARVVNATWPEGAPCHVVSSAQEVIEWWLQRDSNPRLGFEKADTHFTTTPIQRLQPHFATPRGFGRSRSVALTVGRRYRPLRSLSTPGDHTASTRPNSVLDANCP